MGLRPRPVRRRKPAALMVFQDGAGYVKPDGDFRVPTVFDNLIAAKEMPVTIGVFIQPGVVPPAEDVKDAKPRQNRSFEYDTLSDQYVSFLEKEILPEVARTTSCSKDAARTARFAASAPAASAPSRRRGSGPTCSARCSATSAASPTSAAATSIPA